jgi:hypothetical protein
MSETDETLYEHAGGDEGLHRLEEISYTKALADPVLKQLFTKRIPTHRPAAGDGVIAEQGRSRRGRREQQTKAVDDALLGLSAIKRSKLRSSVARRLGTHTMTSWLRREAFW